MDISILDKFESTLEQGLVKICTGAELLKGQILFSDDLTDKWEAMAKEYVADAIENFNQYPEVAIAWAAFLGMGAAHLWDADFDSFRRHNYKDYYGERGFDDMDEHILYKIIGLGKEKAGKISETLDSCAIACLELIRHEGIEAMTADGFYILIRCYQSMFRIGASIELNRLGYYLQGLTRKVPPLSPSA